MKKSRIVLQGGRVIDPLNKIDKVADVSINNGLVEKIEDEIDINRGFQVFDVRGKLVIPGIIDSHVHIIRPGSGAAGARMLIKAGVTTAIEFKGPIEEVIEIIPEACGLNIGVLEGIAPGIGLGSENASRQEVYDLVNIILDKGAIGSKILGGHFPLSPETTKNVIEVTNNEKGFVGFHAGTTTTGSNIEGMEEAIFLADRKPLLLAHINAYCRGLVDDPLEELKRAINILKKTPNVVTESHLASINSCSGEIDKDGLPKSHVTRNCLKTFGYSIDREGLKRAILDQKAAIYTLVKGEMKLIWGEEAYEIWSEGKNQIFLSFPVNLRLTAFACATAKDEQGRFVVDAISTDGGAIPRNFILTYGMPLVKFGALSLYELIWKASCAPAQMFGLKNKGHLSPGSDADITIVEPETGEVKMTIIGGDVCMYNGKLFNKSGRILTFERGVNNLIKQKVPYTIINRDESIYFSGKEKFYRLQDKILS